MSFLQPWLLIALPLFLIPLIIHLVNQWRYQTKQWGAMMFLLAANRMSRGYAKLRQWLILAMRMLAIAGLIFAIARPLASGWLGLSSGARPDMTMILLDRSPSMLQQGPVGSFSKLESGSRQLQDALSTIGSNRWVLIDNVSKLPQEFEKVEQVFETSRTAATSATSDVPGMLAQAVEYLKLNRPGATDIWICSDLQQSDWNENDQQWGAIRDTVKQFAQPVRIHLVAFSQLPINNRAVRITDAHIEGDERSRELVISFDVRRDETTTATEKVPVDIEVDGVRTQLEVDLTGQVAELKAHRIPLENGAKRGWGKISIPADANLADNQFFFVFDEAPARRTVIVRQSEKSTAALALAAGIAPDPRQSVSVQVVSLDEVSQIEWENAGLLLWQGPLPNGATAEDVTAFVKRGGRVIFFPPEVDGGDLGVPSWGEKSATLFGGKWMQWMTPDKVATIDQWRGDGDVLAATRSGAALPVGQLQLKGFASWKGEGVSLATLSTGEPWLARVPTDQGGVYFCASPLAPEWSNVARNGIVVYAMIQRALDEGTSSLGNTRAVIAGQGALSYSDANWQRLAGDENALSTEFAFHSGVYQINEKLIAINRSAAEDRAAVVVDEKVSELFEGLDFSRVDTEADAASTIVQEIWRLFLVAMIIAMIVEAALCVPKLARPTGATA
jgi:hypothetical protein